MSFSSTSVTYIFNLQHLQSLILACNHGGRLDSPSTITRLLIALQYLGARCLAWCKDPLGDVIHNPICLCCCQGCETTLTQTPTYLDCRGGHWCLWGLECLSGRKCSVVIQGFEPNPSQVELGGCLVLLFQSNVYQMHLSWNSNQQFANEITPLSLCLNLLSINLCRSIHHATLCKKASNHHANLPLEMYSFTL